MAPFQLLGRYLRQISKPDLTTRNKQRLPVVCILYNLNLRKPLMRKALTTSPLRRIIEPLRRKIESHCGKSENNSTVLCDYISSSENNCRLYSFTEAVEGKIKYFQGRHEPVPAFKNIQPVYGINKNLRGNQNAKKISSSTWLSNGCM